MIVNAALWVALFFHLGLPMLAWLQVSFLLFCAYGAAQWALVRARIGFNPRVRSDVVGSVIAAGVFAYSVYAYWHMPGYTGSLWWALELGSVVSAIAAIWMDAFRYKLNWGAWTISNCFSWPLFWHTGLWGPFFVGFVYQGINVIGYLRAELGIADVARRLISGIEHGGIPYSTITYRNTVSRQEHPLDG